MQLVNKSVLALFAACAFATGSQAQALNKVRLVIPHANVAIGEEVYVFAVPKALGFFKEEGLDVSMSMTSGSSAAGQLLTSGAADIAGLLAEAVIALREQGGRPKAFYSLKTNNGYTVGVLPGSPIKSLKDLNGKKVGFAAVGSGSDKLLAEQIRREGVEPKYQPISVGTGPGVMTGIRNGQVDALMFWEAIYAILGNQGLKLTHLEVPLQDQLAGYTIAANDEFLQRNPKVAEGFCRAVAKGLHFTLTQPEQAVAIFYKEFPTLLPADKPRDVALKESTNIMSAFLERAQKGVPTGSKTGYEDPKKWAATNELYSKFGQLKGTIKTEEAFTHDFFEKCNNFDRAAVKAMADKMASAK
jgi:NitT/TauT family transport system substrate-binding protein